MTHRNCENVVGFGSHKPKLKTLLAGHLRDPRVQRWPTDEFQEEVKKHVFITKLICRYEIKMKGTLKITKLKSYCKAIY
jgi:hypothetical protein